tara:strand:- start:14517 stop:15161 length:645 start_codon:yes stop_codon:yes gene_type:complete
MPEILIPGPEGRVEANYLPSNKDGSRVALILHPDPSRGGTMNTKVVFNLFKCFYNNGFSTLRFNFRGVGRSEGKFDGGDGELSDSAAILDWLQTNNPNSKICWVAGFSFGAWIAMQLLMRRPEINSFISVSPPADSKDFSFLTPCPTSGIFIHGDKDEIASHETTRILSEKLQKQKRIDVEFKTIKGADHFFINHMDQLIGIADNYIKNNIISR